MGTITAIIRAMSNKKGFYYLVAAERLSALQKVAPKYKVKVTVLAGPGKTVETGAGFKGVVNNGEVFIEISNLGPEKVNIEEFIGGATDSMDKVPS
jgi:hypothetical protein